MKSDLTETPYLSINNINKSFGRLSVLKNISISIHKGEFVSILGPSGCGKTTLLNIIAGLELADSGTIYFNSENITSLPPSQRKFGMVFQSYALFPNMSAFNNIAFGLKNKGRSANEIKDNVNSLLELVGLTDFSNKYPHQLSGGQQQRVALARALALSPSLLLLDEPLSALDARVRQNLRQQLRYLHEKLNMTTILITHDQEEALTLSDKLIVMHDGIVIQTGKPEEIYLYPKTPFIGDFIGTMNLFDLKSIQSLQLSNYLLNIINTKNIQPGKLAIRPEQILIKNNDTSHLTFLTGEMVHSEFRGSFYRLTISINDSYSNNTDTIIVDITPKQMSNLDLKIGKLLQINFPIENLIFFN